MTLLINQQDKKYIKENLEKDLKGLTQQKLKLEKLIKNNESILEDNKTKTKEIEEKIKSLEYLIEKIK